jgi:hypothetical protein
MSAQCRTPKDAPPSERIPGGSPCIPGPERGGKKSRADRLTRAGTLAVLGFFGLAITSRAQVAVAPSETATVNQIIESKANQNTLKCDLFPWKPFLDFTFRLQTGFLLSSNLGQFAPGEQPVTYLRVVPEGASPVLMRHGFE